MDELPDSLRAPKMTRRFRAPRSFVALLLLAVGPAAATVGLVSTRAATTTLHVAFAFVVLMVAFRIIGKRELGRLSPFEFVTLMLVPEIVSELVQGNGSVSSSLTGLSTLFMLVLLTSLLSHRFEPVQQLMESPPTLLVSNGQLLERNMNRERIAPEELVSEMRKQGLSSLRDVEWAILESSGNINFIPKRVAVRAPHGRVDEIDT